MLYCGLPTIHKLFTPPGEQAFLTERKHVLNIFLLAVYITRIIEPKTQHFLTSHELLQKQTRASAITCLLSTTHCCN